MATEHPQPTSVALQRSLSRLTGAIGAAGLTWLSVWVVVEPPEGVIGPWRNLGLFALVLTLPCWLTAARPDLGWARWVPAVTTGTVYLVLAWIQAESGLVGWWGTTELAALIALGASMALPPVAALLAELTILLVAAVVLYQGTVEGALGAGPVAMASAGVRLTAAAAALWMANALLRGAAQKTDDLLLLETQRRAMLTTEDRSRRSDNAARRFLHDSGMNSLEAISRGVPAQSVPSLRERCRTDADRWLAATSTVVDDTSSAFQPALAEATMRGLAVTAEFSIAGRVPDDALEALAGASAEALRNVSKHAGVGSASLSVDVTNGQATVRIIDTGLGFDADTRPHGMGITESIYRQVIDVGGQAAVRSDPASGTQVELRWPATAPASESAEHSTTSALALPALVVKVAWVAVALTALGAMISTAVNWWSVQSPLMLAAIGLSLAATAAWLLRRWHTGRTDSFDVGVAASAVALATLALQVADPFCSAASGLALLPDGRQLVVVIVGVLLASWRASLTVLTVTLASLITAGVLQQTLWPMCVARTLPAGIGLAAVTLAAVAFGRALQEQERAARAAYSAAETAAMEIARWRADDLVRQQWRIAAVSNARDLLRHVADPATDLDDPTLRRQARHTAARLRSVVRARELPGDLGMVLTQMVEDGRRGDFPVAIEGDLTGLVDPAGVAAAARALDRLWSRRCELIDGVTATFSSFAGVHAVVVQIDFTPPEGRPVTPKEGPGIPSGNDGVAITKWSEDNAAFWRAEWRATTNV